MERETIGEKIAAGAEAEIFLSKDSRVVSKVRAKKGYRAETLDRRLRVQRTRLEAKALHSLKSFGANVPRVLLVDEDSCKISMEFVKGEKVRDCFSLEIVPKIARQVSLVHSAGIVHGDLTTSNLVLSDGNVFLIDLGLARFSSSAEDRAVDIHVFSQALESTHTKLAGKAFSIFLAEYSKVFPEVAKRLSKVENRGRYSRARKPA